MTLHESFSTKSIIPPVDTLQQPGTEAIDPQVGSIDSDPYTPTTVDSNLGFIKKRINSINELYLASKEDVRSSDHPGHTLALGALAVSTQAIDRFRTVVLLAPPAVVSAMEQTNNPWIAGAVGASIYASINFGNGEGLTHGMAAYPKTMDTFNRKYPGVVSLFEQSLPGILVTEEISKQNPEQIEKSRKLGSGVLTSMINGLKSTPGKLGLHARRSMAGLSLGSTAFVATESTRGKTKSEVRKTNAKVTADGAVGAYAIGAGMTWGIRELAIQGQMETADKLQGIVENKWTWYAVAAFSVISEYVANHRKNRELKQSRPKEDTDTEAVILD